MFFWMIRGHAAEGLRWYEQILNLPSLPPVAESRALVGAAMMWYSLGDIEHARTALTRALALAHDAGDMEIVAQAEHLFGHVEHALGHATRPGSNSHAALKGSGRWQSRGGSGIR